MSVSIISFSLDFLFDEGFVNPMQIFGNERYLAAGDRYGNLAIYDLERMQHIHTFEKVGKWLRGIAVSKDSRYLIAGGTDECLSIIDFGEDRNLSMKFGGYKGR